MTTINRLNNIKERVTNILEEIPATRSDDYKLYAAYIYKHHRCLCDVGFYNLFLYHKDYELPSFESITRARRKVMSERVELRIEDDPRRREEAVYIAWSKE